MSAGWPQSKRKDQVDAAAGAFNKLIAATAFDSSFSWVAEHEIALTLAASAWQVFDQSRPQ